MPTREEWLKEVAQTLGPSEAAAAIGIDPWRSPFQLWSEKTGFAESDDLSDNEAVDFGLRLEPVICEAFGSRTGREVTLAEPFSSDRHPKFNWLRATPDAYQYALKDEQSLGVLEDIGLLQIKTTSAYNRSDWEGGPPLHYQVQLQTELAVTGSQWGSLCCLIGGQKLRWFDQVRNDDFIAALLYRLEDFWNSVIAKEPPQVDGSLATAKALAKLHPEDNGQSVLLPDDADEWAIRLEETKRIIKDAEEEKTLLENQIKAAIGDATFGMTNGGRFFSWKTQDRKGYTVEPSTCRVLRTISKLPKGV